MTWRKLEIAMCDILREFDYKLDQNPRTGDIFITASPHFDLANKHGDFNVTSLAQELHKRMKRDD
jgi:hypothetical protein